MNQFKHLFSSYQISDLTFKNRMAVSAMVTNYANPDGSPSQRFLSYYEEKARGGFGLLITEDFPVNKNAGKFPCLPDFFTEENISRYHAFTEKIHTWDTRIFAQIYHAGSRATNHPVSSSPLCPANHAKPVHVLSVPEILALEEDFVTTALAAQKAGFDGVEIHGAHGYLINQFTSPLKNKRTDDYGGSLFNRLRFSLEIVRKIRQNVHPDFLICYRLSSAEFMTGGTTLEESKAMAMLLEEAGIDLLDISQGSFQSHVVIPPSCVAPASYVENAAAIKQVVNIPVMTVGRINDPYIAESVLASGQADFVVMARASIADPHLPEKLCQNHSEDLLHCIGCLQGCVGQNRIGNSVRCLVNPITGRESEYNLAPSASPQKVLIAGGGVSGCEAAIAAALKGHQVSLYESSDHLGGQWCAASVPPGKHEFSTFLSWQKQKMEALNVQLHLNTPLTTSVLSEESPDTLVVATGSTPFVPPVPGLKETPYFFAKDILLGQPLTGTHIAVIGGGLIGAETALYLASSGYQVSILEMRDKIAPDGEPNVNYYLFQHLKEASVKLYTGCNITQVSADCILFTQNQREKVLTPVDSIVLACGSVPAPLPEDLLSGYKGKIIQTGDCKKVKNGYYNIQESFETGLSI